VRELYDGKTKFGDFWQVPENILRRSNQAELIPKWKYYNRLGSMEQTDYVEENPWIRDLRKASTRARELIRENNQELDKWLYRWYPKVHGQMHNAINLQIPLPTIRNMHFPMDLHEQT